MTDFQHMPILDVAALNTPDALDYFWQHPHSQDTTYFGPARWAIFQAVAEKVETLAGSTDPLFVLDVGCGTGHLFMAIQQQIADRKLRLTGIDFAPSAIARAQQNVPDAAFLVGDFFDMDIVDDCYDMVTCVQTLEHIADYDHALREMRRIVVPGGHIIITVPNVAKGQADPVKAHVNWWNFHTLYQVLMPYGLIEIYPVNDDINLLAVLRKNENG